MDKKAAPKEKTKMDTPNKKDTPKMKDTPKKKETPKKAEKSPKTATSSAFTRNRHLRRISKFPWIGQQSSKERSISSRYHERFVGLSKEEQFAKSRKQIILYSRKEDGQDFRK